MHIKILAIPDVHLKPWMFERAAALMKKFPVIDTETWKCIGIPAGRHEEEKRV